MATMILDDAFVSINGVDLSDHVVSGTLTYEAEEVDETAMGDKTRINKGGLKNWSAEIEFQQDFAASNVDATLFPLVGTQTAIIIRPVKTGGVSATNPNYTGTGLIQSYPPLGNAVGELAMTTVSILSAGTLSRATS